LGEAVITIDARGTVQFMNLMARKLWGTLERCAASLWKC
jgi:hypothetical protein